jgi:replicative DNA helicase
MENKELRVPPHNADMEEGLLGCLIEDPKEALSGFVSEHPGSRGYFYDLKNKAIYHAILKLQDERQNIDLLTLTNQLKKDNNLEEVGGVSNVASMADKMSVPSNWSYYAKELRDYWIKRQLIETGHRSVKEGYESADASKALDCMQRDVLRIAQDNAGSGERSNTDLVSEYLERVEAGLIDPSSLQGIASGYPDIDTRTLGMQPASVTILAARPSMGKTSLALCMARNMAVDAKEPVGIFSLEMSAESLIARLIHTEAKVGRNDVAANMGRIATAASAISNAPIFIDDRSALSVQQISAAARRMKQQHNIKALFIDYLQLIRSTRDKGSRNDEVAEISNGLKSIAKELRIPVIVLSQLSRQVDKDSRSPKLSDLRDSGAIEQDADVVLFIWRDPNVPPIGKGLPVFVSIEKNREGESGVRVPLVFLRDYTRFENGVYANGN